MQVIKSGSGNENMPNSMAAKKVEFPRVQPFGDPRYEEENSDQIENCKNETKVNIVTSILG